MKAVIKVADAVIVYAVTASVLVWAVSVFVLTFWNVEHLPRLGPFFITYTPPLLIIIDVAELILRRSLEAFVVAAAVCCLVEMLVVYALIACIAGRGFKVRREDMRRLSPLIVGPR